MKSERVQAALSAAVGTVAFLGLAHASFGVASFTSTAGTYAPLAPAARTITNASSTINLASFQTLMQSSFANDTGGVITWDSPFTNTSGGTITLGTTLADSQANSLSAAYGVSQVNLMKFWRFDSGNGINFNNNQGTNLVSGNQYMGIAGSASWTFTFQQNPLSSFGIVHVPRADGGASGGVMTVFFTDNSKIVATGTSVSTGSTPAYEFFGFQAPTGKLIQKIAWVNSGSTSRWDDLGFTVPTQEAVPSGSVWQLTTGGSWDTASNWSPSGAPNASAAVASLGNGSVVLAANSTIDIPAPRTLGVLNFKDSFSYTVSSTATGALVMDNGANQARINDVTGSHSIAVPVSLNAAGLKVKVFLSSDVLTMSGNLSGAGILEKDGPGTLVLLNNTATHSGTLVTAGVLQVGNNNTLGDLGSGNITVASTGTLSFKRNGNYTIANNISGVNGFVQQDGNGTLTFSGANTFGTSGGGLTVNAGTVVFQPNGGIPTSLNVTVNNGGTFELNGNSVTLGGIAGNSTGVIRDSSADAGNTVLTLNTSSAVNVTFLGRLLAPNGRTLQLVKDGAGIQYLQANTTSLTGDITVLRGDLGVNNANSVGAGTIIVSPNQVDSSDLDGTRARFLVSGGIGGFTVANNFLIKGYNAPGTGAISVNNINESFTLTGTITQDDGQVGAGGATFGGSLFGVVTVNGPINQIGSVPVSTQTGNIRFNGGTTLGVANFQIKSGTTSIGVDNGLPIMAVVDLGLTGASTLNLNGFNQTLGGLTRTGTGASTVTTAGGGSTLTLNVTGNVTYTGTITNPAGAPLNVVKTGTGTQTFSGGATTFTGNTTVTGGVLKILTPLRPVTGSLVVTGPGATVVLGGTGTTGNFALVSAAAAGTVQVAVSARATPADHKLLVASTISLDAGTVDLTNNDMLLTGVTESDVRTLVASWYHNGARDGTGLASSTAGTTGANAFATLAVVTNDNLLGNAATANFDGVATAQGNVLVKYTYLGDADLNGKVDVDDYDATLLGMADTTLTGWRNGDFNYDGVINQADLDLLSASMAFNGASFDSSVAVGESTAAVPEPAAAGLMGVAMLGMTRRRRR